MNKIRLAVTATLVALGAIYSGASMAAVGVSVNIGEPGFYGQIDLGDAPPPQVVYAQPRIIQPVAVEEAPIYLRVPPGYARDWAHHCNAYNACGRRVYFVKNDWYTNVYAPHYREVHGHPHHDEHHDNGHHHGHGHDDDHHDHGHH